MANIIDYLIWRGDVPMSVDPFNEVDALVLCQFEYIKLDGIVSANLADKISLQDVHRQYSQVSVEKSEQIISYEQDKELLRLMAESRRFGNIAVSGYVNIVNNTEIERKLSLEHIHEVYIRLFEALKLNEIAEILEGLDLDDEDIELLEKEARY